MGTVAGIKTPQRRRICRSWIRNPGLLSIPEAPFLIGSRSQGAPRPRRHELVTDTVEIGQSKHRLRSGKVLRQAAIPHLGESPEPLHDVKRMLAPRANPRPRTINTPPSFAERLATCRPTVHSISNPRCLELPPIRFLPVG